MSRCDNFIEPKLFEWNFQLDMNFNIKNMKMIINICIKILKSQSYKLRFPVPALYIFTYLMIWKFHCYLKFVKTLPKRTVLKFLTAN